MIAGQQPGMMESFTGTVALTRLGKAAYFALKAFNNDS